MTHEWDEQKDCQRIVDIAAQHNFKWTIETADEVWRWMSDIYYAAGFIGLPEEDEEVWRMIGRDLNFYLKKVIAPPNDLANLERIVETHLQTLRVRDFPNSAINWADFHCVQVLRTIDKESNPGWQILIEEGNYNAGVDNGLTEVILAAGYTNFEIRYDW